MSNKKESAEEKKQRLEEEWNEIEKLHKDSNLHKTHNPTLGTYQEVDGINTGNHNNPNVNNGVANHQNGTTSNTIPANTTSGSTLPSTQNAIHSKTGQLNPVQNSYNPTPFMVNESQLPDFGDMKVYDYQKDIDKSSKDAKSIVTELADLYLGKNKDLFNHSYIQAKIDEDSRVYATSLFLEKMSQKMLVQLLTIIDTGDQQPRLFEVANQTMKEIRENIKDARSSRSEIEKLYKNLRQDFGLNATIEDDYEKELEKESSSEGIRIDHRGLNGLFDQYMKEKKAKETEEE